MYIENPKNALSSLCPVDPFFFFFNIIVVCDVRAALLHRRGMGGFFFIDLVCSH